MLFVSFLRHSPSLFPEGNLVFIIIYIYLRSAVRISLVQHRASVQHTWYRWSIPGSWCPYAMVGVHHTRPGRCRDDGRYLHSWKSCRCQKRLAFKKHLAESFPKPYRSVFAPSRLLSNRAWKAARGGGDIYGRSFRADKIPGVVCSSSCCRVGAVQSAWSVWSVWSVRSVWSVWSVRYSSCFRVGAVYSAWSRTRFLNWICTTAVFLPWCSALHLIIRSGWDVDDPSWDLSDLSDQFDFGVNMKRSLHSRPALSAAIECLRVYHIFSFLRRCKCVCDLPHQVDHTFSPARSHTTFSRSIHNYSNFTVDMTSPALWLWLQYVWCIDMIPELRRPYDRYYTKSL